MEGSKSEIEKAKQELEEAQQAIIDERDDIIDRLMRIAKRYPYDLKLQSDIAVACVALKIFMK